MKKNTAFQQLTFREKLDHIWTYYRYHILAGAFVLFVLLPLAVQPFFETKSMLDVLMITSDVDDSTPNGFEEFFSAYGYEYYDGAVSLNTNLGFFDGDELAQFDDPAAMEMEQSERELTLISILAGGNIEVFFGTGDTFLNYAGQGILTDLCTVLPEDLLAQYEDQFIYTDEGGTVDRYPCAVVLSDNPWVTGNGYYDECYFGVMYNADDPEIAADFAEFLLSYQ